MRDNRQDEHGINYVSHVRNKYSIFTLSDNFYIPSSTQSYAVFVSYISAPFALLCIII